MNNKFIEHMLKTIDIHRAAVSFGEDFELICQDASKEQKVKLECEYSLVATISDILDFLKDKDIETIKDIDVELYTLYRKTYKKTTCRI